MSLGFDDDHAVRRLISEYCFCLDQHRLRDLAQLFAEDGTWEAKYGSATGPAAIESLLNSLVPVSPARRHIVANTIIDGDAPLVEATSYYLVTREGDAGPFTSVVGTYFDRIRKTDDGWKFVHRRLQQDIAGDLGLTVRTS